MCAMSEWGRAGRSAVFVLALFLGLCAIMAMAAPGEDTTRQAIERQAKSVVLDLNTHARATEIRQQIYLDSDGNERPAVAYGKGAARGKLLPLVDPVTGQPKGYAFQYQMTGDDGANDEVQPQDTGKLFALDGKATKSEIGTYGGLALLGTLLVVQAENGNWPFKEEPKDDAGQTAAKTDADANKAKADAEVERAKSTLGAQGTDDGGSNLRLEGITVGGDLTITINQPAAEPLAAE